MAQLSHKRDTPTRFTPKATTMAASLAVLATTGAVAFGVFAVEPNGSRDGLSANAADPVEPVTPVESPTGTPNIRNDISRGVGGERAPTQFRGISQVELMMQPGAIKKALKGAKTQMWTTANLNLWSEPGRQAKKLGLLPEGEQVTLTGRKLYEREEIVWGAKKDKVRWVSTGYFSAEEPFSLGADCTNGTSVPDAVSENIKLVHQAVCANFPEITTYGTLRSDGEHAQGIAIDIMVSGDRGFQVRDFILEHYQELGVHYIIYSQHIWMTERQSWVGMEDRGSITANHYDHVHVTVYP